MDLEVVRSYIMVVIPGPTLELGLLVCCCLSFLNTNAIKFIIKDLFSTTDTPTHQNISFLPGQEGRSQQMGFDSCFK